MQNKALSFIIISPWYVRNDAICRELNDDPIKTFIKKISINFFENFFTILNEIVFEIPTIKWMAIVGGHALTYFFLML